MLENTAFSVKVNPTIDFIDCCFETLITSHTLAYWENFPYREVK